MDTIIFTNRHLVYDDYQRIAQVNKVFVSKEELWFEITLDDGTSLIAKAVHCMNLINPDRYNTFLDAPQKFT